MEVNFRTTRLLSLLSSKFVHYLVTGYLDTKNLVNDYFVICRLFSYRLFSYYLVTGYLVTNYLVTGYLVTSNLVTGYLVTSNS